MPELRWPGWESRHDESGLTCRRQCQTRTAHHRPRDRCSRALSRAWSILRTVRTAGELQCSASGLSPAPDLAFRPFPLPPGPALHYWTRTCEPWRRLGERWVRGLLIHSLLFHGTLRHEDPESGDGDGDCQQCRPGAEPDPARAELALLARRDRYHGLEFGNRFRFRTVNVGRRRRLDGVVRARRRSLCRGRARCRDGRRSLCRRRARCHDRRW